MPRYFFHIRDGAETLLDLDGLDLPDMAPSRDERRRIVQAVLEEAEFCDRLLPAHWFEVVDDAGETVLVVPFRELAEADYPAPAGD